MIDRAETLQKPAAVPVNSFGLRGGRKERGMPWRFWDIAAVGVLLIVIALVISTFRSYGVSNDEGVQQHYGELILKYYRSGFADRSVFSFDNLYLYGGLFDVTAIVLHHIFPMELYDLRHLMTAFIGVGGICAAIMLARLVAGPRAGALAGIVLSVSGSWYGPMFTHTKDIPLASAMTAACYFLVRASRDLPSPRWRDALGFGIATGCALGIKVLALLLPIYAGIIILCGFLQRKELTWKDGTRYIALCFRKLGPALIVAYVLMITAWPWAALSPFNPVRGLFQFSQFHYHIATELAGHQYEMASVPRLYIPIYLSIREPLIALIPALFALLVVLIPLPCGRIVTPLRRYETAAVGLMVLFPLCCQVIGHGPAFTGMRHFTFVVPLIAVLAAIGMETALASLGRIHWLTVACALTAILVSAGMVADVLVELHPYEYLYYNPLVGGLQGAARRYDTDYWVAVMPAAVSSLSAFLSDPEKMRMANRIYSVGVCGEHASFDRELRVQHLKNRLRWTDDWDRADFYIAPTHGDCDRAIKGRVVAKVERMGVLIGVVKDLRNLNVPAVAQNLAHRKS
ncbi:ArnT family glycosyltransferase [Bradyrhizobium sp.]|uniref:ArnT family glycosyltransferase n=1 Tax=Bradyrhizobium sp. TaxID=376 RepID=UPI0039E33DD3